MIEGTRIAQNKELTTDLDKTGKQIPKDQLEVKRIK